MAFTCLTSSIMKHSHVFPFAPYQEKLWRRKKSKKTSNSPWAHSSPRPRCICYLTGNSQELADILLSFHSWVTWIRVGKWFGQYRTTSKDAGSFLLNKKKGRNKKECDIGLVLKFLLCSGPRSSFLALWDPPQPQAWSQSRASFHWQKVSDSFDSPNCILKLTTVPFPWIRLQNWL